MRLTPCWTRRFLSEGMEAQFLKLAVSAFALGLYSWSGVDVRTEPVQFKPSSHLRPSCTLLGIKRSFNMSNVRREKCRENPTMGPKSPSIDVYGV